MKKTANTQYESLCHFLKFFYSQAKTDSKAMFNWSTRTMANQEKNNPEAEAFATCPVTQPIPARLFTCDIH